MDINTICYDCRKVFAYKLKGRCVGCNSGNIKFFVEYDELCNVVVKLDDWFKVSAVNLKERGRMDKLSAAYNEGRSDSLSRVKDLLEKLFGGLIEDKDIIGVV